MGLGIAIARNNLPEDALAEVSSVEVQERIGEMTTYRLRYDVDIFEGDLPWLIDDRLDPESDMSILVPVEDQVHCLVKGPVNGHNVHMRHGGSGSSVEVSGLDTSALLDHEDRAVVWQDASDSDVVSSIVSTYGMLTDIENTSAQHVETKHSLVQRESDLRFIRRLARRNGFMFWITSDPAGIETAHFKSPPLDGDVETELYINIENPNIDTIDLRWDLERPVSLVGRQLDLNTLEEITGFSGPASQTDLGNRGFDSITKNTRSVHSVWPVDDAGDFRARGEAVLSEADWFISANLATTLDKLGVLIRTHMVITLGGAGTRYSGKYFVSAVRHTIDATQHLMEIELSRNGWE